MEFKCYEYINNEGILEDIKRVLTSCDKEFVPPLSKRRSTTQAELLTDSTESADIMGYFKEISKQYAIIAIEKGKAIAFMSFKKDYLCEYITKAFLPNVYVTTVIVNPEYRNKGIAGKMYDELIKHFPSHYIFTRTWSTNFSHIHILLSHNFHTHCTISCDRGRNIDTNYYRHNPKKLP